MNSSFAHRPTSAAADVGARIAEARATHQSVRIEGAGRWLSAGRPVTADTTISLLPHSGIVEYVPGDLTLTALAGTPLSRIAAICAEENQWLPLDPFGSMEGTIGATVATASAGPLAHSFGTPRDNVVGVEFVTGAGNVVRGGGRVTKNVAGFDLTRLIIGSWGTLGVLTELTVRLRPRPEIDETLAIKAPASADALDELLRMIRGTAIEPAALEMVNGAVAGSLGMEASDSILIRLCGNEASIRAQSARINRIAETRSAQPSVWTRLRESDPPAGAAWRMSSSASGFTTTWTAARALCSELPGARIHGTISRGIVRCTASEASPDEISSAFQSARLNADSAAQSGTVVYEILSDRLWPPLSGSAVSDRLSRGIRAVFDPGNILNPGILGATPEGTAQ